MSFEASVNNESPSPKCYKARSTEESQSTKQLQLQRSDNKESGGDEGAEDKNNDNDDNNNDTVAEETDEETDVDEEDDVHLAFPHTGGIFKCSSQVTNY